MSECASIRYILPVATADAMTGLYPGTIRSRRRSRCTDFGGAAGNALGKIRRQPNPVPNLGKVKRASGPLGQLQSFWNLVIRGTEQRECAILPRSVGLCWGGCALLCTMRLSSRRSPRTNAVCFLLHGPVNTWRLKSYGDLRNSLILRTLAPSCSQPGGKSLLKRS